MSRTARDRTADRPKPVTKIELAGHTSKWKGALAVLFLLVGAGLLGYSLTGLLTPETGWQAVEAAQTEDLSCAGDFVLLYPFGVSGVSPRAEQRALTALYGEKCVEGYRLFTADMGYAGVVNPHFLNLRPNEPAEADPALYAAFSLLAGRGDRTLYLAPILETYGGIFSCENDAQAAEFDPYKNDALREHFAKIAAFARDPEKIDLRLLGENRVELFVSEDYLAFAKEQEITRFIDFGAMKNAFLADFIAGALMDAGYTRGTLSSYDGFARNLDAGSTEEYALTLYDREGLTILPAASLRYRGARAFATLRNFPLSAQDACYVYSDGTARGAYLDPADGLPKAAMPALTVTSDALGCAELMLAAQQAYAKDALDEAALAALPEAGAQTAYCAGGKVYVSDPALTLADLYKDGETAYVAAP